MNITNSSNTSTILIVHEQSWLILKVLVYGVTPCICFFGIVGNVLSIVILKRHGLHKCSNILLVSLAFCDICYLVGFNNVPKALFDIQGKGRWIYPRGVVYILYFTYFIFNLLDYGMGLLGLTIPVFITIERLVAVFLPLKMSKIVTPFRTWFVVIFFGLYCLSTTAYILLWSQPAFVFDSEYNVTVGVLAKSKRFYSDKDFRKVVDQIHFGVKIQPVLTFVGCVFIIVKVKLASIKRQKMSSGKTGSSVSKTTQTLMAVSVVYLVVCGVLALPSILPPSVLHFNISSDDSTVLGHIFYQLMNFVLCLNSSWNFIIYIVFNKNFRDTYKQIISKYRGTST